MPRPKPPEEFDPITVRVTKSVADKLKALAEKSRTAKGLAMSTNQYCAAILTETAETGVVILERIRYDRIPALPDLKVAEPPTNENPPKKRTGT